MSGSQHANIITLVKEYTKGYELTGAVVSIGGWFFCTTTVEAELEHCDPSVVAGVFVMTGPSTTSSPAKQYTKNLLNCQAIMFLGFNGKV